MRTERSHPRPSPGLAGEERRAVSDGIAIAREPAVLTAPAQGTRLGERYLVLKMGSPAGPWIYLRARDERLEREVDLALRRSSEPGAESTVRALSHLRHPSLPHVLDGGKLEEWDFVAFEPTDGPSLDELANAGKLSTLRAIEITLQSAEALRVAHGHELTVSEARIEGLRVAESGRVRLAQVPWTRTSNHSDSEAVSILGRLLSAMLNVHPSGGGVLRPVRRLLDRMELPSAEGGFAGLEDLAAALQAAVKQERLEATQSLVIEPRIAASPPPQRRVQPVPRPKPVPRPPLAWNRRVVAVVGVLGLLAIVVVQLPAYVSPAPYCARGARASYAEQLAKLHDRLGDVMGRPVECAHANQDNADTVQKTSAGLAYVRASSGLGTFTTGAEHWALSPRGLLYWASDAVDPPRNAAVLDPRSGPIRPG